MPKKVCNHVPYLFVFFFLRVVYSPRVFFSSSLSVQDSPPTTKERENERHTKSAIVLLCLASWFFFICILFFYSFLFVSTAMWSFYFLGASAPRFMLRVLFFLLCVCGCCDVSLSKQYLFKNYSFFVFSYCGPYDVYMYSQPAAVPLCSSRELFSFFFLGSMPFVVCGEAIVSLSSTEKSTTEKTTKGEE